jgi:hypothetical protein
MRLVPPTRPPRPDPEKTSLGFVDVLFAIVVGKILDLSVQPHVPAAGTAQLMLTLVTTVLSYVGYRNSLNRRGYLLRPLTNIPFWHFVVDVALVYLYFRMAVTSESARSPIPSATLETVMTMLVFALYVVWDLLASAMRRDTRYEQRPPRSDVVHRHRVTRGALFVTVFIVGVVLVREPTTPKSVVVVDAVLVVLMIGYRYAKELVVPRDDDKATSDGTTP